jgi:Zn-finger nucleic acid-binding protein
MNMEAHLSAPVEIDLCTACRAFWFDKYEDMKISSGSTLKLIEMIQQNSAAANPPMAAKLDCPRCFSQLVLTHDLQGDTKFAYWRCPNDDGRFMGFTDFMREKKLVRALTPQEINALREKVQTVNCSHCGGAINLATDSICAHCGSPISLLEMKQPQQWLDELKQAPEPRLFDPSLFKIDSAE